MLEIIIILLIIGLVLFGYKYMNKASSFDITVDGVFFHEHKKTIAYSNLVSIERDMTNSIQGRTMYFSYVITFYNDNGQIDSFRFYQALTDQAKWNRLKSKINLANPAVKINESIL